MLSVFYPYVEPWTSEIVLGGAAYINVSVLNVLPW